MPFVLDASVALSWIFPDERHPAAEEALALMGHELPVVPAHWILEMANALVMAERRKRITPAGRHDLWVEVKRLNVEIIPLAEVDDTVFGLARQFRLTAYDALYLALARGFKKPLATLDASLAKAARAEGVAVVGRV